MAVDPLPSLSAPCEARWGTCAVSCRPHLAPRRPRLGYRWPVDAEREWASSHPRTTWLDDGTSLQVMRMHHPRSGRRSDTPRAARRAAAFARARRTQEGDEWDASPVVNLVPTGAMARAAALWRRDWGRLHAGRGASAAATKRTGIATTTDAQTVSWATIFHASPPASGPRVGGGDDAG
jgi:hypothetical protein